MFQTSRRDVPVNLRQSGNPRVDMLISTRVRKSPFWHRSVQHGVRTVTVYNNMYHPRLYFPPEEGGLLGEHAWLTEHVTLWNVAVERQIRIKGPDALPFVDWLVTRAMTGDHELAVGKVRYVVLCDERGGIVNDPICLRIAEDEFWLSISDSDVLLWARGLNCPPRFDIDIREIDVAPVQIQGPKAKPLMSSLFGETVDSLKSFNLAPARLGDCEVVISRTGFSAEPGYEIYLRNATRDADALWDTLVEAGKAFDLKVIAPAHISRLESGILSYGQDMDIETNPFEVGLDWQVDLDKADFVGKQALKRIREEGVARRLVGLRMGGRPLTWYNPDFWPVSAPEGPQVGYVTSAFYSPRLGTNIALAMVRAGHDETGLTLEVALPGHPSPVPARIVDLPFATPARDQAAG